MLPGDGASCAEKRADFLLIDTPSIDCHLAARENLKRKAAAADEIFAIPARSSSKKVYTKMEGTRPNPCHTPTLWRVGF